VPTPAAGLPHQIARHAHPKARPETPPQPPRPTTGIDYLALIDLAHTNTLAGQVNYAALADPAPTSPKEHHDR
jgi:putative transposase